MLNNSELDQLESQIRLEEREEARKHLKWKHKLLRQRYNGLKSRSRKIVT